MVSIILVNYNTYAYTEKCISSIYEHTRNTAFEIIVVSNGCSDRNIKELLDTHPLIQLIENSENLGFAKANNIGIKAAGGKHVLLLNSDTELKNNAVNIAQNCLNDHPDIGVVSAQLQYPDGKLQHCCQSFPSIMGELLETTRLYKLFDRDKIARRYLNAFLNLKENTYCDWVWGTFFMFRYDDLELLEQKKLSERFFMYGEDMEWCYQFMQIGLKAYYCADAKVVHHLGKSDFGSNSKKFETIIRNEVQFITAYKGARYAFAVRMLRSFKFLLQSIKDKSCFQFAVLYANTK
ncbi:MAG: glycosyltransferase family 2 protein [Bacteroidetes bacterium]|nr:glycosyltransferase family 2 protein [Bacteroidota bacterium]